MKRTWACGSSLWHLLAVGWMAVALAVPAYGQLPTESDVYLDRGVLAYDQRQYPEALQAFQEALRLNPDNVNALYYTGLTYMAMDQPAAAQGALEQARKLAPADPDVAFQLAVADFTQQQYDAAEPLFRQVAEREPTRPNLGYYLGFLEYRNQRYREALRHFRANVASDENYAQLTRFYAGLALSALGLAGQARSEIEEAIRLQPTTPLSGPAERFRDVLGPAATAERTFHVDTKVGFYYDDNAAVVAGTSGDPAAAASRSNPHRTLGQLGYVRMEYTPLRTPDWEATFAGALLGTYNDNLPHYNVLNPSGMASLNYHDALWDKPVVWNLTYLYDYMALDGRDYLSRHTVAAGPSVLWSPGQLTQAVLRYQNKNFLSQDNIVTPADNRNANNYMAGVMHYVRFEGDRHFLKGGYQIDYDAAEGTNWKYLGNRFLLGGQYTLPLWDLRFRYDWDWHMRDYRDLHTYLPLGSAPAIHRIDREMNNLFSLSKDLPNNFTLSLEYLFTWNYSNLPVYDYTRNVISFNVSWRY